MPYTEEQRRLFNAAAHDKDIADRHGMSRREARKLADEANELASEGKEKKASDGEAGEKSASFIDLSNIFGPAAG